MRVAGGQTDDKSVALWDWYIVCLSDGEEESPIFEMRPLAIFSVTWHGARNTVAERQGDTVEGVMQGSKQASRDGPGMLGKVLYCTLSYCDAWWRPPGICSTVLPDRH